MKPTSVNVEVYRLTKLFRDLRVVGISNLADVELTNLDALLALWKQSGLHNTVAMVNTLKHVSAHGPFLSHDRLSLVPWPHRSAQQVAGWKQTNRENTTPRIPEEVMRPFLAAALFYVQIASGDLLAAQRELTRLKSELPTGRTRPGSVRQRLDAFIAGRRAEGRGLPSLPLQLFHNAPGAEIRDGVVQAPNLKMIQLLISSHGLHHYRQRIVAAGNELGWEVGGIPVTMSPWPATGKPWHPGLSRHTVFTEINHLRIACWVVIAYLSGMRDDETGRSCI
ncbi:hypothetical protein [Streptomyces gilvosporeus]|nr:hypothetical protein [Streptomyces gilvosporeus]